MRPPPLVLTGVLAALLAGRAVAAPPILEELALDLALEPPAVSTNAAGATAASAAPHNAPQPAAAGEKEEPTPGQEPSGRFNTFFDGATLSNKVVAARAGAGIVLPKGIGRAEAGVRGGVLHPGEGTFRYAGVDAKLSGDRRLEWSIAGSYARLRANTNAPPGTTALRSPAASGGEDGKMMSFSQTVKAVIARVGASFRPAQGVGLSIFAGAGAWELFTDVTGEGDVGAALAVQTGPRTMVTAVVDGSLETGRHDMYNNEFGLKPEALRGQLAVTHTALKSAWKASFDVVTSPSLMAIVPSILYTTGSNSLQVSSRFQRSKTPFLPNERALAASLSRRLSERVTLELTGRMRERDYESSPETFRAGTGSIGFSVSPGRLRARAETIRPLGSQTFDAAGAERALAPIQATTDGLIGVTLGFATAKDFSDFTRIVAEQSRTYEGLLSALQLIGKSMSDFNYNYGAKIPGYQDPTASLEGPSRNSQPGVPRNLNDLEELFRQVQASWGDKTRRPVLQCLGQSQANARIIIDGAEYLALNIKAMASAFTVPRSGGKDLGGHTFLAIIGPDGKVTIQDWSRITPMGTGDVLEAFRMYQQLTGAPGAFFEITDPERGEHRSFVFTEEGHLVLENATVFGPSNGVNWNNEVRVAPRTMEAGVGSAVRRAQKPPKD